ncbi:MAG TPA: hypothetical protein VFX45_08720 [Solirubrobacterales bacterium]|nr:hypothetical protein [Solirubrobacterales bacterium]
MLDAGTSPRGRGLLLVAAAVAAIVLAILAAGARADAASEYEERAKARNFALRLNDLPPGYVLEEDDCGVLDIDGPASPALTAFANQNQPGFCAFTYERRFRARGNGPSTPVVLSASSLSPSVPFAEMAATLAPDLVDYLTGPLPYTEVPSPAIGDTTRLFHIQGETNSSSILLWRSGRVLNGLLVRGNSFAATDALALEFGARQQAHAEHPSPYLESEGDDDLVELDDPRLRAPVYWLGAKFSPGHGFPSARPTLAFGRTLFGERMRESPEFAIGYSSELILAGWTPAAWARFSTGKVERRDWTWHCTRSRQVRLRQGHAIVYAAYKKDYASCPSRPPRHYFAHAFLPGAVIGIGQSICNGDTCDPFPTPGFDSFRGMATIARGLHVRPPRTR